MSAPSNTGQRAPRTCPNCGTASSGRFCPTCGQDNHYTGDPLEALGIEFLAKLLSGDSKLWRTLLRLLFLPGTLSQAFSAGRRTSYVHPRKLYLFTSLVFFVSISLVKDTQFLDLLRHTRYAQALAQHDLLETASSVVEVGQKVSDSLDAPDTYVRQEGVMANGRVKKVPLKHTAKAASPSMLVAVDGRVKSLQQMNKSELRERVAESFSRHFPKLVFMLVPVFALMCAFFFGSKHTRYVDHLVFAFHAHSAFFALAIICLLYEQVTHQSTPASLGLLLIVPHFVLSAWRVYRPPLLQLAPKLIGVSVSYACAMGLATVALAALTVLWL